MQDSLFHLHFLCFCSYAIAARKCLSHTKQRVFKGFQLCCSYTVAAEQKARKTYDNILRLCDDPDVTDVIRFLREREVVHYQRFGEALRLATEKMDQKNVYAVNPTFDRT